jgi:zinc transport system substrate-binding protein
MTTLLKTTVGAALLATTALVPAHADDDVTAWRLFVADHETGTVSVVDAEARETLRTLELDGPTRLYRTESGEAIFAVQGAANTVSAISSGIAFHDHGDHADIDIEDAALLDVAFEGGKPSHFVEHRGDIAIFFDGDGTVATTTERAVLDGSSDVQEFDSGAPHHGAAAVFAGHVLITEPHPEDSTNLPIGIKTLEMSGEAIGDLAECPDLHGEASSGNIMVFACETGLLVVTPERGEPKIALLAYSEDLPDGKVTTLIGGVGLQYFMGNYGPNAIVLIDPVEEANAFRLIDLPTRRVHFAVDPIQAKFAYVFTEDGSLHQIDVLSGEIAQSVLLTEPYSMDGHWSDPRPRIAVAGDHIVVTDPLAGKLHLVERDTFEQTGKIELDGTPFNIVAVGGTGAVHDEEEAGHSHGNGHHHAQEASGSHDHSDKDHDHAHSHDDAQIYAGYFDDSHIADRPLADYEGDWQSVYPYLQDGTLDPVWEHKAESGDKTAEDYREEYEIGYRTNVERITIEGDMVTFYENGEPLAGRYTYDGYEVLTYKKGNRGVRFIFERRNGDEAAPQFIQFSDHKIAPEKTDHFHLYWGDDRAALLEEVTNWPTYYPSSLEPDGIVREMMAH